MPTTMKASWKALLLALLAALALPAAGRDREGWQPGSEYTYEVRARTLAALHQVADQYSGVVVRAQLALRPTTAVLLAARLVDARVARVHQRLPAGWGTAIPDNQLSFRALPVSGKPFQIKMRRGVVVGLVVSRSVPTWEVNVLKSIVGQLQVDTQAEHLVRSRLNSVPSNGSLSGVFKTMEADVTGECEVAYDVSPLPRYQLQSRPELVPVPRLDGNLIDVVKAKNYSRCAQRPGYHFGLDGETDAEPGAASMGDFMARSSVSRVVLSGSLQSFTVQSSVTTNKIVLSPVLSNSQKGMVVSRMNLTLRAVTAATAASAASGPMEAPADPRQIKDLVYDYDDVLSEEADHRDEGRGNRIRDDPTDLRFQQNAFRRSLENAVLQPAPPPSSATASHAMRSHRDDTDSMSHSSPSSESSSSEEPPGDTMLPFFGGFLDPSIQPLYAVRDLAQQIARELQRPAEILEKATLAKFSVLTRLVRTMDHEQLEQATRELFAPAASEDVAVLDTWRAFRDAVAQAGTGPALLALKGWILSRRVRGEEAAELVAALPAAARAATEQYLEALFDLAKHPDVQSQPFLNVTAVLAFADLVREARADSATARRRFATLGHLRPERVQREYVPYLSQCLALAVQDGDSHRVQVYARALGNVAHPAILAVLEPYLEGRVKVSAFQRLHMVVALDRLAQVHPKVARAVLFRLYQNGGEDAAVRCVAVSLLMRTSPPASMLQRMAEFTSQDPSEQVRSAVKSAIESAARRLRSGRQKELSQNAAAAVDLLTPKQWGAQHSKIQFWSEDGSDMRISYKVALATLASEVMNIPRAVFLDADLSLGGVHSKYLTAGAMASSVEDLLGLFFGQWKSGEPTTPRQGARPLKSASVDSKWTIENVTKMLNLQPAQATPVEANLLVGLLGQQRFFAVDKHSVEALPQLVRQAAASLRDGKSFKYTKMYNKMAVTLGFPTATGLPFVLQLKNPSVLSVGGEALVRTQPDLADGPQGSIRIPDAVTASASVELLYSTKLESRMGFTTPFDHHEFTAGLDRDLHLNLPLRAEVYLDIRDAHVRARLQPTHQDDEKVRLVALASRPYTAQQDALALGPADQRPIHVRQPRLANLTVGQDTTGMAFRVDAASEGALTDFAAMFEQVRHLCLPWGDALHAYEVSVSFEPRRSSARSVLLTAAYDSTDDQHALHGASKDTDLDFFARGGPARQRQLMRSAALDIHAARASVVDLSAQFDGYSKASFVATAAVARSPVDATSRVVACLRLVDRYDTAGDKDLVLIASATARMPNVPVDNYRHALQADPNGTFEARVVFSALSDCSFSVNLNVSMERSAARKECVRLQPSSKACEREMQRGSTLTSACRDATLEAGRLDLSKVSVIYEGLPQAARDSAYNAYAAARFLGWEYHTESLLDAHNGTADKLEMELRFAPDLQSASLRLHAPALRAEFSDVRLHPALHALALHPMYSPLQMAAKKGLMEPDEKTCTIDMNTCSTFEDQEYYVNLGSVMHCMTSETDTSDPGNPNKLLYIVEVRDDDSKGGKEVFVILGADKVDMHSDGNNRLIVGFNGVRVEIPEQGIVQREDADGNVLVSICAVPNDAVRFDFPRHQFRLLYTGAQVVVTAPAKPASIKTQGLCGDLNRLAAGSGMATPGRCLARDAKQLVDSWALSGARREPQEACVREEVVFGDVVSESEAGRGRRSSEGVTARPVTPGECTKHRIVAVAHQGLTCFSARPQPTCNPHCHPAQQFEAGVDFRCVPAASRAARLWSKLVELGGSPNLGPGTVNTSIRVSLPEICHANGS